MKALRILPGERRIEEIELPDDQRAVAEAIQKALGGGAVKLPDFFDGLPNGDTLLVDFQYNTNPSEVRSRHPLPTKPPPPGWFGVVLDDNRCFGPYAGNAVVIGATPPGATQFYGMPMQQPASVKTTLAELELLVSWL